MPASEPARARGRARLGPRSVVPAVTQLSVAVAALAGVEVAVLYSFKPLPPWPVLLFPATAGVYLAAGVVAWLRRPANRTGAILTVGALVWAGAGLVNTLAPTLIAVGLMVATMSLGIVVHLLHAFPSGRLRGRLSKVTVAAGYLTCVVLQAPDYLWGQGPGGPTTVLQIASRPDLARAGYWVQTAAGSLVMAATAVVAGARLARATPAQRRLTAPLYGYGIAAVLWVPASANIHPLFPFGQPALAVTQIAVLAGIPVAFVTALLAGGFARAGQLEELGAWLGEEDAARPALGAALAGALGDSSLSLAFWAGHAGGYVDAAGQPVTLPAAGPGRAAVEVDLAGRRVGAIVYDSTLIADPALVRAAGRVIGLALDRERLTAELRASRDQVRASRARIVAAADAERRRIARDLHDGLQTRLLLLAIKAHSLRAGTQRPGKPNATAADLHDGLQAALSELRGLVHGVMPAALAEGGLYAATKELTAALPVPVRLNLDEPSAGPLPPPVESAGYFVVSEALANAVKHSKARELAVSIAHRDGCLRVEVCDDGIGGARPGTGAGLRGMTDRVEALDGRLIMDSPPGGGTKLVAEVPCAS